MHELNTDGKRTPDMEIPMGRSRKPTALKIIDGNAGKRALNHQEPAPDYLQDLTPPQHLSARAADVWNELAPQLRKARLLTELDKMKLEMCCDAIAQYRDATRRCAESPLAKHAENGGDSLSPWALVQSMSFKRANSLLSEFGGSPAARTRLIVNPQEELFDSLGAFIFHRPASLKSPGSS